MPKPSASSPPQRSRQSIANTSAARCASGQVVLGHAPEEVHRSATPRVAARFSSRVAVPAATDDRDDHVGRQRARARR